MCFRPKSALPPAKSMRVPRHFSSFPKGRKPGAVGDAGARIFAAFMMQPISRRACLFLAGFCLSLSPAYGINAPLLTLHFEQLSVKQGLAQETVTTIVQDRRGF